MIFGNIQRFAIEYDFDSDSGGVWMFGHACYWICGERVGEYELSTTLRDLLFIWERMSCDANRRTNAYLMSLDTALLVNTLHDSMFGGEATDEALEMRALEEQWATHNIGPELDFFDQWQVYLIEDEHMGRCVYQRNHTSSCKECQVRRGEFDDVLNAAVATLLRHYNHSLR